jgi:hypothetical protein
MPERRRNLIPVSKGNRGNKKAIDKNWKCNEKLVSSLKSGFDLTTQSCAGGGDTGDNEVLCQLIVVIVVALAHYR